MKILDKYNAKLTKNEKLGILKSFPGKQSGDQGMRLNIAKLYDQQYSMK